MAEDQSEARTDHDGVSGALKDLTNQDRIDAGNAGAVGSSLKAPLEILQPVFKTYTHGFEVMLQAEEIRLRETVADIDAQLRALNAQRDNAMLAFSMLQAARVAKTKGEK